MFPSGYVQGGSDGMPILGDFAVKYGAHVDTLGVPGQDLMQALIDTAENTVSGCSSNLSAILLMYFSLPIGIKVLLCPCTETKRTDHCTSRSSEYCMEDVRLYTNELD
jgi:hypothetical protein